MESIYSAMSILTLKGFEHMENRKTLWIRDIDFNKLKDLLHIIKSNNGELRAVELENIAINRRVLIKQDGKPLARSPRYFYRKVLENLQLAEVKDRKYFLADNPRSLALINLSEPDVPLSEEAKEVLREIIIHNPDCKKFFFDLFIERQEYSIKDLRSKGKRVIVETKSMGEQSKKSMILRNDKGKCIELDTQDRIFAIFEGLRKWALKLEIIDEYMYSFSHGRILYPIKSKIQPDRMEEILFKIVLETGLDTPWALIHVPNVITKAIIEERYPIQDIKEFLEAKAAENPNYVTLVKSSTAFIDISTPYEKQESAIRKLYIKRDGEGYISHLRVNKAIVRSHENG